MEKLLNRVVVFTVLFFAMVFFSPDAWSGELQPTIQFSFDGEISEVDHFELHWIPVPGSAIMEYLFTLGDPLEREWKTPVFNMPEGKERPFYLVAVMSTGAEGWSPAYLFRFTREPFILYIKRGEG